MSRSKKSTDAGQESDPSISVDAENLALEEALERLESTARRLEQGDLPLEEALALFEQGVALTRRCTETLEAAERRIEILVADREGEGGFAARPFDAGFDAEVEPETLDDEEDEGEFEED